MTLTPTWQRGDVQLYLGDCRDVLPHLPKVDAVVTDPPYGIGFKYESHDDNEAGYSALMQELVSGVGQVLKTGGLCFVWQAMRQVENFHKWFPSGYRIFASCKNFTQHLPTPVQFGWDPVVWWTNGKTEKRAIAGMRDFHIANTARWICEESNGHPCPRPIDAVEHVVQLASVSGDIVLDPFSGSGTTGVAAVKLGRKFIGIEIEPKYFDIAVRRISEAQDQFALFEPVPPPVKQAELFGGGE